MLIQSFRVVHGGMVCNITLTMVGTRTFIWNQLDQQLINDEGFGTSDFSTGVLGSTIYIYGGWAFTQSGQIEFNNIRELYSSNASIILQ